MSLSTGFGRMRTGLKFSLSVLLSLWTISGASALEVSFDAPDKVSLGEPFVVSLTVSGDVEKSTLSWRGRNYPMSLSVAEGGVSKGVALLGTDVARSSAKGDVVKIWVRSKGVNYMSRWKIDVISKSYPAERLSVPPAMVNPPGSERDRIARERKAVRKVLRAHSLELYWSLPMVRPVSGIVTSVYGKRRIYNGIPRSRHGGVDYRASVGTPVKSASSGRVVLTGDHYYAGKSIYVDHGGSVVSMYFHLSEIDVREGQFVRSGEVIGKTGRSGRVTGPHLHFGVSVGGRMVDPTILVERDLERLTESNLSGRMAFPY